MKLTRVLDLFILISTISISFALKPGCVELYEHCNYQGRVQVICNNEPKFCNLNFNQLVSAVKLGPNTKVTLFSQNDYNGRSVTLSADTQCLVPMNFNDVAESAKITRIFHVARPIFLPAPARPNHGCVLIFEHCHYKGNWQHVCHDVENLFTVNFAKKISSIKVSPGLTASLYSGVKYTGKNQLWTNDDNCFLRRRFNDQALSIRVRNIPLPPKPRPAPPVKPVPLPKVPLHPRIGCVFIFEHIFYRGRWLNVCGSLSNLGKLKWNKKISSVKVGPLTYVQFYERFLFGGRMIKFDSNEPNLVLKKWNDLSSSMKVFVQPLLPIPKPRVIPRPRIPILRPPKGCVYLYEHINYLGNTLRVCSNINALSRFRFANKASSIRVGPSTIVVLFNGSNFLGRQTRFTSDQEDFRRSALNDKANSVKVYKIPPKPVPRPTPPVIPRIGCITMFEHIFYKGAWMNICGSIDSFVKLGWNDKTSSVKIGFFTKATFYADINFSGRALSFQAGRIVPDLRVFGFNDIASSVKVYRITYKPVFQPVIIPKPVSPILRRPLRPSKGCAVVFEHAEYKGTHMLICGSFNNLFRTKWNKKISSIWIGPQTRVTLIEGVFFVGKRIYLTSDVNNLGRLNWDNKTSSLRIERLFPPIVIPFPPAPPKPQPAVPLRPSTGCVILHEHIFYRGRYMKVCHSINNFTYFGWNDMVSSVKVGDWTKATFYEHINFRGRSRLFLKDHPNFVLIKWNDIASSIRVYRFSKPVIRHRILPYVPLAPANGCIFMFEHINYGGRWMKVCGSISNFVPLGWNDMVSSVKVGPWTFAIFYWDIFFKGKAIRFNTNEPNLVSRGWNDQASSVRVFKIIRPREIRIRLRWRINLPIVRATRPLPGCMVMFEDILYKGKWMRVCGSVNNFVPMGWNDKVSSVWVSSNTRVFFYEDIHFRGKVLLLTNDFANFVLIGWNDKASSVRVFRYERPRPRPAPVFRPRINPTIFLSPHPNCIIVYEHIFFQGKTLILCGNNSNLAAIRWGNTISSVKVGVRVLAVFYSGIGFSGARISFWSNESNLVRRGWNDRARSVKVNLRAPPKPRIILPVLRVPRSGCIHMYEDINFGGRYMPVCGSIFNFVPLGWNDKVSSIKVGTNTYCIFYEHIFYRGRAIRFSRDEPSFLRYGWNDIASSVRVYKLLPPRPLPRPIFIPSVRPPIIYRPRNGCIIVYEDIYFGGRSMNVCGSVNNLVPSGWNDKISSVKVGLGAYAVFYEHINYRGRSITFRWDENNFVRRGWNDVASSIRVYTYTQPRTNFRTYVRRTVVRRISYRRVCRGWGRHRRCFTVRS